MRRKNLRDETSEFSQGEEDIFTSYHFSVLNHQIHDVTEESMYRQKAETLKQQKGGKCSEDTNSEVGSEPQSIEATEDLKHNKDVSPTEKVVSDLETNEATVSDCTQIEEDLVEVISSYGHEEIKVDQEQPLNTEVGFKTVSD